MKKLFLSAALFAAMTAPGLGAALNLEVFDGATLVGSASSSSGSVSLTTLSDPAFSDVNITAAGNPLLPGGDLTSVTLDITSGSIVATHTLTVDVFQSGISVPASGTLSSFTLNDLVGVPGPTTESTFINGDSSTLGTPLATHTFAPGDIDDSFGPVAIDAPALTADAHQFVIDFTAPGQSANDTIELSTGVPEPATWVMLVAGFALMGVVGWRRSSRYAI